MLDIRSRVGATNWFLPVNRIRSLALPPSSLRLPSSAALVNRHPVKLENRSIFACRRRDGFNACKILSHVRHFWHIYRAHIDRRMCTRARARDRASLKFDALDLRRETRPNKSISSASTWLTRCTFIMLDLGESPAAVHVYPEAGRGVNARWTFLIGLSISPRFLPHPPKNEKQTDGKEWKYACM